MKNNLKEYEELIIIAIVVILLLIPYINRVFKTLYTLIHEFFHAFTSILTSGKVEKIELYKNNEGIALTKSSNRFSAILISLSGYILSSIFAWSLSYLIINKNYIYILYLLIIISTISLIFFVRNLYGIIWIICCLSILILTLFYKNTNTIYYSSIFYTSILLIESFISPFILMYIYLKFSKSGDAENLKKITKIPAIIWILCFIIFSSYFFYLGSINLLQII